MLEYRPKGNLEDNKDLTMVVSNENIHAEKPVPDSSDNNGKICANAGRVQLSSDHPSGKTLFDSVVGSNIENQMKSAPITHASTDMEYSPKKPKKLTNKLCEKVATEKSGPNIGIKKFAKIYKFLPSRRPVQAKIGLTISFLYSPENDPSGYWLQGVIA